MPVEQLVRDVYERLWTAYGPQGWWPGDSKVEIVVGAILTQNTAWPNVERAMQNLRTADCLTWTALRDISQDRLGELIRQAGTYRVKAARLKTFVRVLWDEYNGSLESLLNGRCDRARHRLLAIRGIGPETADAILLYAGQQCTFVVDAYTRRVLRRHRIIEPDAGYEHVQQMFHRALPQDQQLYNECHALIVAVGKNHCRSSARCDGCPLEELPHDPTL